MALALPTKKDEAIPVPTEWEWNTFFAVPRFRSTPDPPACLSNPFVRPPRLCLTLRRLSSSSRILPRHPCRKCIYVLCKASNRRWPREPDARRVINTDALVPSPSPNSTPSPPLSPIAPMSLTLSLFLLSYLSTFSSTQLRRSPIDHRPSSRFHNFIAMRGFAREQVNYVRTHRCYAQ